MKNEFRTKDLYEAAYLVSANLPLLKLEKADTYFVFVFSEKSKCEAYSSNYWSGFAVGKIKDFADALKILKERLFAKK